MASPKNELQSLFGYHYPHLKQKFEFTRALIDTFFKDGKITSNFDLTTFKLYLNNLLYIDLGAEININKEECLKLLESDYLKPMTRHGKDHEVVSYPIFRVTREKSNGDKDLQYFLPCSSLFGTEYGHLIYQIERSEVYSITNEELTKKALESITNINMLLGIRNAAKRVDRQSLSLVSYDMFASAFTRFFKLTEFHSNLNSIKKYYDKIATVYPHTTKFLPDCELSHIICSTYIYLLTNVKTDG